jgi:hypothetical protein
MNIRNLEQRLERLEQQVATAGDEIRVICVRYVPYGALKGFKNDKGFFCARLPGEREEQCYSRASELVREHEASIPDPRCAILLIADCEDTGCGSSSLQGPRWHTMGGGGGEGFAITCGLLCGSSDL